MRTLSALVLLAVVAHGQDARKTRNLIFVTCDGLRWQEVFRGSEERLLERGMKPSTREALMPFLWSTIAKEGQIYGNRDKGSEAYVTNGKNFSYPGYNEMFSGFGDPRIDSNDKKDNPNINALEVLNRKYRGSVAAFGSWDAFPFILNTKRSGVPVIASYEPLRMKGLELLNRLKIETGIWRDEALDAPVFHSALAYLRATQPRVFYIGLGDTDEWAHAGKYENYIDSIRRSDSYLKELWEAAQSMSRYRGTTTLVLAVDHGRGDQAGTWKSHGEKLPESKYIWLAAMGPDTKALGERSNVGAVTQSQIAATLLALMGEGRDALDAKAAAPIAELLGR